MLDGYASPEIRAGVGNGFPSSVSRTAVESPDGAAPGDFDAVTGLWNQPGHPPFWHAVLLSTDASAHARESMSRTIWATGEHERDRSISIHRPEEDRQATERRFATANLFGSPRQPAHTIEQPRPFRCADRHFEILRNPRFARSATHRRKAGSDFSRQIATASLVGSPAAVMSTPSRAIAHQFDEAIDARQRDGNAEQ